MGDEVYVFIDLVRIQTNMLRDEGGCLTVAEIRNWLLNVGFKPDVKGKGWIGDREALRSLNVSEFVRARSAVAPARRRRRRRGSRGRGPRD